MADDGTHAAAAATQTGVLQDKDAYGTQGEAPLPGQPDGLCGHGVGGGLSPPQQGGRGPDLRLDSCMADYLDGYVRGLCQGSRDDDTNDS